MAGDDETSANVVDTIGTEKDVSISVAFEAYPLLVGVTQVTSANAADTEGTRGWSYDAEKNLTLSGLTIEKPYKPENLDNFNGIYYNGEEALTIELASDKENTDNVSS